MRLGVPARRADPQQPLSRPCWGRRARLLAGAALLVFSAVPVAAQTASGGFRYRAATGSDGDQSQISVADNEGGAYTMLLTWRCAGDSGYHLFVSGTPLTGDSVLAAQWRFDQDAPHDASWAVTPNHAWARNEVNAFTSRALTAREVSIRLTNAGGSFITATFSLQGAREAMSRLACLRQLAAVP